MKKKSLELASGGKRRCNARQSKNLSDWYCRPTVTKTARTNAHWIGRVHTDARNQRRRSLHNPTGNPFSIGGNYVLETHKGTDSQSCANTRTSLAWDDSR